MNGDRSPTAVVGAPGAFVGSAGTTFEDGAAIGAAGCCASAPGRLVTSSPPAAAAAPAMRVRRLIGGVESGMSIVECLFRSKHGWRRGDDRGGRVRRSWQDLGRAKRLMTLRVVRDVGGSATIRPVVFLAR